MTLAALLATTISLFGVASFAEAETDSLEILWNDKKISISVKQMREKLGRAQQLTINDPLYKKQKTFVGFWFKDILQLGGLNVNDLKGADELILSAKDGYAPTMDFSLLHQQRAFLAFGEAASGKFTEEIPHGKGFVSPAPFYLVWDNSTKLTSGSPWPYQLVRVEAVNFSKTFSKIYPKDAATPPTVRRGFILFKNNCLKCHSINLQGGEIGPELNVPKNITEYWDQKTLRSFIINSESFRAKSKMPAFDQLSADDIGSILAYLKHMRKFKVLPDEHKFDRSINK